MNFCLEVLENSQKSLGATAIILYRSVCGANFDSASQSLSVFFFYQVRLKHDLAGMLHRSLKVNRIELDFTPSRCSF